MKIIRPFLFYFLFFASSVSVAKIVQTQSVDTQYVNIYPDSAFKGEWHGKYLDLSRRDIPIMLSIDSIKGDSIFGKVAFYIGASSALMDVESRPLEFRLIAVKNQNTLSGSFNGEYMSYNFSFFLNCFILPKAYRISNLLVLEGYFSEFKYFDGFTKGPVMLWKR